MNIQQIENFTWDYLDCAAFCEELEEHTFSGQSFNSAMQDCLEFIEKAGELLNRLDHTSCAHDFYYTRHGHGCGFWDREDLPVDIANKLTGISKSFVERPPYVENGLIYLH